MNNQDRRRCLRGSRHRRWLPRHRSARPGDGRRGRPGEWHRIEVAFASGDIRVSLDGKPVLAATDPTPHLNGRVGWDVPLHVAEARVRGVTFS